MSSSCRGECFEQTDDEFNLAKKQGFEHCPCVQQRCPICCCAAAQWLLDCHKGHCQGCAVALYAGDNPKNIFRSTVKFYGAEFGWRARAIKVSQISECAGSCLCPTLSPNVWTKHPGQESCPCVPVECNYCHAKIQKRVHMVNDWCCSTCQRKVDESKLEPWQYNIKINNDNRVKNGLKCNKCESCGQALVAIGSSRSNGSYHDDWDDRRYHKQCFRNKE
jgi:hypothetical protein